MLRRELGIVASWIVLAAMQAPASLPPALVNGDFSEVVAGSPVGWAVNRRNGSDPGLILAAGDGIARISPGTAVPGQWARLIQRIDAAPWRGKVVRLSADLGR